jgi:hypothetical protein
MASSTMEDGFLPETPDTNRHQLALRNTRKIVVVDPLCLRFSSASDGRLGFITPFATYTRRAVPTQRGEFSWYDWAVFIFG